MEEKKSTKFEKTQEAVVNRLHGDRVIWVIYFLLCLISIALIYSASSSLAHMKGSTNFGILMKQLRFVVIGFVALYICYKVPPKWYRRLSFLLYGVSVLLLIITLVAGSTMNDAQRWLSIGGIQFQPAEIAKIAIVLYLARALEVMQ
ncbi:MAG: FtsW/RodA/SpoVE family cell cycle protein, partial [Bacteroidales bacterium]|nr:FtsW/RodA/SpoVE family cell cycle protein [Bacteroidales bacterium]